jgi:tetratricopeptide (TPR) repeat protein
LLALLFFDLVAVSGWGQVVLDEPTPPASPVGSLGLSQAQTVELEHAIGLHDYIAAEKLLLAEIDRDPHSPQAGRLLAFAGSIYFLDHDFLNAAIAWKKSEAIAPLDPRLKFSLAMAYIRIFHPDWARKELESLAARYPQEALYPYWLGRLDYDGHEYNGAIRHFQHAIELDPGMARAHDNLGLCYYYQNQNDLAVKSFRKAIELDRDTAHPSPWPYLNLAITLEFLNQFAEAETNLREAIRLDPVFAQAHFRLGVVLERMERPDAAIQELREAARLDATYAEPHMAMARIYHKLGQEAAAHEEVQIYLRLHPHSTP